MKVVYVDYIFEDENIEKRIFNEAGIEFINASGFNYEEQVNICKDADGVVSTYTPMDREFISKLENCKVLVRTGIGFNTIDLEAASEKNIMVANVRDYCIDEVADHALAMTLSLIRKLPKSQIDIKKNKSWSVNNVRPIQRINTLTAGLYGIGAIGRDYGRKMKAIGFNIIAYDPFLKDEEFEKLGFERVQNLDEIFGRSDVVSVHSPLNKSTYHTVNENRLKLMKPSAYFINVSRGEIVDEKALTKALREGKIAGAGLDVLESENPNLDDEIVNMDNVIITPHSAYYSIGAELSLQEQSAEQAVLALTEGQPKYFVNKDMLK